MVTSQEEQDQKRNYVKDAIWDCI